MSEVKTPQELLSAVPFLLSFHPENSIVVIGVKSDALEVAMRLDFPTKEADRESVINGLLSTTPSDLDGVILIGYLPNQKLDNETDFMLSLFSEMEKKFLVREVIIVWGEKFRSLICMDSECCPADGNPLPDFTSSRITAEQVASGKVLPFQTSDDLVKSLEAYDTASDSEFIALVTSTAELSQGQNDRDFMQKGARTIDEVFTIANEQKPLSQELVAKALGYLTDIQVRDYALGVCNDPQLAHDTYLEISKFAPKGFISPITALTSAFAYELGNGAEAHRLLDRAIADNSEYSLARLLRRVFSSGWPVEGFAQLRSELHSRVVETIFG